ncbi:hypothetical protein ACFCYN_20580 [Gottfriedia sp. NPDC056225]|uniref:hypothetical protein n=1 Tax=Gottfriedia sp. NPDC056225 TaxID=3345751 RepID=UPI0035E02CBA
MKWFHKEQFREIFIMLVLLFVMNALFNLFEHEQILKHLPTLIGMYLVSRIVQRKLSNRK